MLKLLTIFFSLFISEAVFSVEIIPDGCISIRESDGIHRHYKDGLLIGSYDPESDFNTICLSSEAFNKLRELTAPDPDFSDVSELEDFTWEELSELEGVLATAAPVQVPPVLKKSSRKVVAAVSVARDLNLAASVFGNSGTGGAFFSGTHALCEDFFLLGAVPAPPVLESSSTGVTEDLPSTKKELQKDLKIKPTNSEQKKRKREAPEAGDEGDKRERKREIERKRLVARRAAQKAAVEAGDERAIAERERMLAAERLRMVARRAAQKAAAEAGDEEARVEKERMLTADRLRRAAQKAAAEAGDDQAIAERERMLAADRLRRAAQKAAAEAGDDDAIAQKKRMLAACRLRYAAKKATLRAAAEAGDNDAIAEIQRIRKADRLRKVAKKAAAEAVEEDATAEK